MSTRRGTSEERRPSLVPVFLNSTVAFAVGVILLLVVFGVQAEAVLIVIVAVVLGVAFGAIVTWTTARSQRAIGGPGMTAAVQRALRVRALPYAADPLAWRPALATYERRFRRNRWLLPAEFGFAALVVLYGSLLSPHPTLAAGPVAVLFLGIGLATSLYMAGMQRRTAMLLAEFDAEGAPTGDGAAGGS